MKGLFEVAESQKQLKFPIAKNQITKLCSIYLMKYHIANKSEVALHIIWWRDARYVLLTEETYCKAACTIYTV